MIPFVRNFLPSSNSDILCSFPFSVAFLFLCWPSGFWFLTLSFSAGANLWFDYGCIYQANQNYLCLHILYYLLDNPLSALTGPIFELLLFNFPWYEAISFFMPQSIWLWSSIVPITIPLAAANCSLIDAFFLVLWLDY